MTALHFHMDEKGQRWACHEPHPHKPPASEFCDRHRGWVDEGRTRVVGVQRWCEGCIELRSPKPIAPYPRPTDPLPPTTTRTKRRRK